MSDLETRFSRLSRRPGMANSHLDILQSEKFDGMRFSGEYLILWTENEDEWWMHAYRMNAEGGFDRLWSKLQSSDETSEEGFSSYWHSHFLDDDRFATGDYLYEVSTGKLLWKFPKFKGEGLSVIIPMDDGLLLGHYEYPVLEGDKEVYYKATGVFDGHFNLLRVIDAVGGGSVCASGKLCFSRSTKVDDIERDETVCCVDILSGEQLWQFDSIPFLENPRRYMRMQIHAAGKHVLCKIDALLVTLDAVTSECVYVFDIRKHDQIYSCFSLKEKTRISIDDVLVSGELCVLQYRKLDPHLDKTFAVLVTMNYVTGDVLWTRTCPPAWDTVLVDDKAFFCVQNMYPVAIALEDGRELWRAAKQTAAGGRFVSWNKEHLCVWSDLNDCFAIYRPLPEGVTELITVINVETLQQKLRDALLPGAASASKPLLEKAIDCVSKVSDYRQVWNKPYDELIAADLPLTIALTELIMTYYPDLDDPDGCAHEVLRLLFEVLTYAKAVLDYEKIIRTIAAGSDGYVTSMLMELAALTTSDKKEELIETLMKNSTSDYVLDAYERIHGRDGI